MGTLEGDFDDTPTNLAKPLNGATITVRVVKSFEYRVAKSLILHNMDLEQITVGELKLKIRESTYDINGWGMRVYNVVPSGISAEAGWKPYRTVIFGTCGITRNIFHFQ